MQIELKDLEDTQTWTLCSLPTNKTPTGCKRVYGIKYIVDGSIDMYKAHLVAKGYT